MDKKVKYSDLEFKVIDTFKDNTVKVQVNFKYHHFKKTYDCVTYYTYDKDPSKNYIELAKMQFEIESKTFKFRFKTFAQYDNKYHRIPLWGKCAIVGSFIIIAGLTTYLIVNRAVGVTYKLLWDTKIEKVTYDDGHEVKVEKDKDGYINVLKYNKNGEIMDEPFKVLLFTDSHLDHNQDACNFTYTMMVKNIMDVKPDFVAMCGDNVTSTFNRPRLLQFGDTMEKLGVYWACCLGNHEGNTPGMSREDMIGTWAKYDHCLLDSSKKYTTSGELVWGNSNSIVNFKNSKGVTQTFCFLDSGSYMPEYDMKEYAEEIERFKKMGKADDDDVEYYDYVKDTQITWYRQNFDYILSKNTETVPTSVVFTHHPLGDLENALLECFDSVKDEYFDGKVQTVTDVWPYTDFPQEKAVSLNDNEDGYIEGVRNRRREGMCYGPHDLRVESNGHTRLFNTLKHFKDMTGKPQAIFFGHDHQNNFAIKKEGVVMAYAQPAEYSSNNLWTKGMLGDDPKNTKEAKMDGLGDWLMQGYTLLGFDSNDNRLNQIENKENYLVWDEGKGEKHFDEACDYIDAIRKTKKQDHYWKSYDWKDTGEDLYPNDPNNPKNR